MIIGLDRAEYRQSLIYAVRKASKAFRHTIGVMVEEVLDAWF